MSADSPPVPGDSAALDAQLSEPTPGVVDLFRRLPGDLIVLGVGGKMGPTLARMAKRASELAGTPRRVIGVSRFSNSELPDSLRQHGIEPVACDLLDERAVERLPDAPLVVSMSGFKFGAAANPALTWAMNCYLPAIVCRRYARSRIVAFSSGNVYPRVTPASGGSTEAEAPEPVGEYAMSVLGRERIYEYFSRTLNIPLVLSRLNYATELRYGVLVDLARQIWDGAEVDLEMAHVNVIWQRDANAHSLQALAHTTSPPTVLNIAGADLLQVRAVCLELGRLLGRTPRFRGTERPDALLNNASRSYQLFGAPPTPLATMLAWTAAWVRSGGESLHKPTHFSSRSGKF